MNYEMNYYKTACFWNIDGAAKHLFIAAVNCVTIFVGLVSNIMTRQTAFITGVISGCNQCL